MKSRELTIVCAGFLLTFFVGWLGYRDLTRMIQDQAEESRKVQAAVAQEDQRHGRDNAGVRLQIGQVLESLGQGFGDLRKRSAKIQGEIADVSSRLPLAPGETPEDRTAAIVESMEGKVGRDDAQPKKPVVSIFLQQHVVSNALFRLFKQCKDLRELRLPECTVADQGLRLVAELPELRSLDLTGAAKVTNATLAIVKDMKQLRELSLAGTAVNGEGLLPLAELKQLESLDLSGLKGLTEIALPTNLKVLALNGITDMNDATLEGLDKLDRLEKLFLRGSNVADAGVVYLKVLKQLRVLDLTFCRFVRDEGLSNVKDLAGLQELLLGSTQITDAGLENVRNLKELTTLDLEGTNVTDAGIGYLAGLPKLRQVIVDRTQVTDAGRARLKKMLKAS